MPGCLLWLCGQGCPLGRHPAPQWTCQDAQPCGGPSPPTCMPQMRTPRQAEVLCAHFLMWRAFFSSDASSPCCRVPIFRSRIQGCLYCDTTFSSSRNPGRAKFRKAPRTWRLLPLRRRLTRLGGCLGLPSLSAVPALPAPHTQAHRPSLRIQSISFAGCFNKSIYLGGVYNHVSFFSFSFLL